MGRKRGARSSASVRKVVASMLAKQIEMKHKFVTSNSNVSSDGFGLSLHNFIDPGTGVNDRIGDRINAMTISMNGRFGSSATNGGSFRVFCVETRRPLAFISLGSNTFDLAPLFDQSEAAVGRVAASFDWDWVKRVYHDKRYTFNQTVTGNETTKFIRYNIRFGKNGKRIVYDQDTVAPATTMTKTYIYVCYVIDDAMNTQLRNSSVYKLRYIDP